MDGPNSVCRKEMNPRRAGRKARSEYTCINPERCSGTRVDESQVRNRVAPAGYVGIYVMELVLAVASVWRRVCTGVTNMIIWSHDHIRVNMGRATHQRNTITQVPSEIGESSLESHRRDKSFGNEVLWDRTKSHIDHDRPWSTMVDHGRPWSVAILAQAILAQGRPALLTIRQAA